jgi:hypothetical protein
MDKQTTFLAIASFCTYFGSNHTNFRNNHFGTWLYFVVWNFAYIIPFLNIFFEIFDNIILMNLIAFVSCLIWVFGWIIMINSSWIDICSNYRPIANMLIAYQIIWIFLGYSIVDFAKKTNQYSINIFKVPCDTNKKNYVDDSILESSSPDHIKICVVDGNTYYDFDDYIVSNKQMYE